MAFHKGKMRRRLRKVRREIADQCAALAHKKCKHIRGKSRNSCKSRERRFCLEYPGVAVKFGSRRGK